MAENHTTKNVELKHSSDPTTFIGKYFLQHPVLNVEKLPEGDFSEPTEATKNTYLTFFLAVEEMLDKNNPLPDFEALKMLRDKELFAIEKELFRLLGDQVGALVSLRFYVFAEMAQPHDDMMEIDVDAKIDKSMKQTKTA